jgi:hypothetical protein
MTKRPLISSVPRTAIVSIWWAAKLVTTNLMRLTNLRRSSWPAAPQHVHHEGHYPPARPEDHDEQAVPRRSEQEIIKLMFGLLSEPLRSPRVPHLPCQIPRQHGRLEHYESGCNGSLPGDNLADEEEVRGNETRAKVEEQRHIAEQMLAFKHESQRGPKYRDNG